MVEAATQTTNIVIAPVVKKEQWARKTMHQYHHLIRKKEEKERFDQEASPLTKKFEEVVREFRQETKTNWFMTSSEL